MEEEEEEEEKATATFQLFPASYLFFTTKKQTALSSSSSYSFVVVVVVGTFPYLHATFRPPKKIVSSDETAFCLVVYTKYVRNVAHCVLLWMETCTIENGNLLYNTQWKKTGKFRNFYIQHTMGIYSKTHLNDTIFWEAEMESDLFGQSKAEGKEGLEHAREGNK